MYWYVYMYICVYLFRKITIRKCTQEQIFSFLKISILTVSHSLSFPRSLFLKHYDLSVNHIELFGLQYRNSFQFLFLR